MSHQKTFGIFCRKRNRLQPYGDGTRRLIWIKEFTKNGYHRKATIDKVKDGEVILT